MCPLHGPSAAQRPAQGVEIHGWGLHVGIARLLLTPQRRVLIEALAFLFVGAEVLADPCPQLGAGGGTSLAEVHQIAAASHALNLHLAERAALTSAWGDCGHASHAQNGQLRAMSEERAVLRVLQLSDPHLLADPRGRCRGRVAMGALHHAWQQALAQLGQPPDLLLISGDLCQDESLGGYVHLRELLELWGVPAALLPGNHDHPGLMRAALGRQAWIAPAVVPLAGWQLLLLNSHRPGSVAGWLDAPQLAWLQCQLQVASAPVLVALHHPPVPIGSPELDAIALRQPERLWPALLASAQVRGVVFGHVHQHWHGQAPREGGGSLPLWACPSTLAAFSAVQPCPLGRPDWPGGRLIELSPDGVVHTRLLRWPHSQGS